MGATGQPPLSCHATANASSTEAEELRPAPRGTSEAMTASIALTASPCAESAHATPAGYLAHPGRGSPSTVVRARSVFGEKAASAPKSSASTRVVSRPLGENATY